jgi:tudor domain-containing protein 1/4/6/7
MRVSVCYAYSPTEFYIQYTALLKQLASVNERVHRSVAYAEPLVYPVAGLPCIALFSENGEWYRAKVLQVLPASIRVQYVDYGNIATVPSCVTSCQSS